MLRRRHLRFGGRRRGGIGSQHADDVGARLVARDAPAVSVAALDHDVARTELVLAVVEAEHDAAVDHDHEVEGVGGVHAGLVRVVAVDADPVAAALAGPGKRMIRTEQPPAGRLQPHRTIRFVAAVVDRGGGSVEPQPGRDREAVRPDRALRFAVGDDHRSPVGVVPGDHSPCREVPWLPWPGPYATGRRCARTPGRPGAHARLSVGRSR